MMSDGLHFFTATAGTILDEGARTNATNAGRKHQIIYWPLSAHVQLAVEELS